MELCMCAERIYGFFFKEADVDIFCLQETKMQEAGSLYLICRNIIVLGTPAVKKG